MTKLCGCVVSTMLLLVVVAAAAVFYPQWAYQVDQLVVEKKLLSSDPPVYRVELEKLFEQLPGDDRRVNEVPQEEWLALLAEPGWVKVETGGLGDLVPLGSLAFRPAVDGEEPLSADDINGQLRLFLTISEIELPIGR